MNVRSATINGPTWGGSRTKTTGSALGRPVQVHRVAQTLAFSFQRLDLELATATASTLTYQPSARPYTLSPQPSALSPQPCSSCPIPPYNWLIRL
jgi:hypothetical protein